jgi:epoxyqueuosine reductase
MNNSTPSSRDLEQLKSQIGAWASELEFDGFGVSDTDITVAEKYLFSWLKKNRNGEMTYMARHGTRRTRAQELIPDTIRVLSLKMNYWKTNTQSPIDVLSDLNTGYIARYALGRDYHKLIRQRLKVLADRISLEAVGYQFRAYVDSAPVMEKPLAVKGGLGWIGKHTNLIDRKAGSWFFLGELYTNLPLPIDTPQQDNCGTCRRCIAACPTNAIVAPYELDARLCISYLTIELKSAIPEALRPLIGNRIFGCDDCQLVCPWNKYATESPVKDFSARHELDATSLIELFRWTEIEYDQKSRGSAIRRTGYECWLRNIAVALGNAPTSKAVVDVLLSRLDYPSELVHEHIVWALLQHKREVQ